MRWPRRTYAGYSIGVAIAWALRLVLVWRFAPADKRKSNMLVFLGFVIGWTSATIARQVYPPPAKYRASATPPRSGGPPLGTSRR